MRVRTLYTYYVRHVDRVRTSRDDVRTCVMYVRTYVRYAALATYVTNVRTLRYVYYIRRTYVRARVTTLRNDYQLNCHRVLRYVSDRTAKFLVVDFMSYKLLSTKMSTNSISGVTVGIQQDHLPAVMNGRGVTPQFLSQIIYQANCAINKICHICSYLLYCQLPAVMPPFL